MKTVFLGKSYGSDKYAELNGKIDSLAKEYGVSSTAIAASWILRHILLL